MFVHITRLSWLHHNIMMTTMTILDHIHPKQPGKGFLVLLTEVEGVALSRALCDNLILLYEAALKDV